MTISDPDVHARRIYLDRNVQIRAGVQDGIRRQLRREQQYVVRNRVQLRRLEHLSDHRPDRGGSVAVGAQQQPSLDA